MFFKKKRKAEEESEAGPKSLWLKFSALSLWRYMSDVAEDKAEFLQMVDYVAKWFPKTERVLDTLTTKEVSQLKAQGWSSRVLESAFQGSSRVVNVRLEKSDRKPKPIRESKLALRILAELDAAGIGYALRRSQLTPEGELEDFDNDSVLEEQFGEDQEKWPPATRVSVGTELTSGRFLITEIEIYEDQNGEFAYWYSDLLLSNLPMSLNNRVKDDLLDPKAFESWALAEKLFLPARLANLAFLAENRLMAGEFLEPIMFKRSYFFSPDGVGESHNPKILVQQTFEEGRSDNASALPAPGHLLLTNQRVGAIGRDVDGTVTGGDFIAANSIRFGWTFDHKALRSTVSLKSFLVMLSRAADCVEEGYDTYRGAVSDAEDHPNPVLGDYHYAFLRNDLSLIGDSKTEVRPELFAGAPTWIPQTHAMGYWERTYTRSKSAVDLATEDSSTGRSIYDEAASDALLDSVLEGFGPPLPHLIATLAYSVLIPRLCIQNDGKFYLSSDYEETLDWIERVCGAGLLLPESSQQANALSNAGIASFQVGDLDTAERRLLLALEHPSKFNEAEASYVLGQIFAERGDQVQAAYYLQRSDRSGGYSVPSWIRTAPIEGMATNTLVDDAPKLSKKNQSSFSKTNTPLVPSKFCIQCGQAFLSEDQRFCMQCGEKRT